MSYILFSFFDEEVAGPENIAGVMQITGFTVKFSSLSNVTVTWSGMVC